MHHTVTVWQTLQKKSVLCSVTHDTLSHKSLPENPELKFQTPSGPKGFDWNKTAPGELVDLHLAVRPSNLTRPHEHVRASVRVNVQ